MARPHFLRAINKAFSADEAVFGKVTLSRFVRPMIKRITLPWQ